MRKPFVTLVAILALGVVILGASSRAGAQATPAAGGGASHPAHIHNGTCAELGDVVQPFSNVSAEAMNNSTPMAAAMVGSSAAIPVLSSVTTVQMALQDILNGDHAINVHESAENIGNYIACGNIGGMVMGGTDLAIGIAPLNDSGYSGAAWLHDNGDGTTTVNVFLMEGGMMHDMGTADH